MLSSLLRRLNKYRKGEVLIYQMGKVGSSSLESAIPNSIQVHDLYFTPPCYVHRGVAYPGAYKYMLHRLSLVIKRNLFRMRKQVKIISIVRDPFERNISMFFQSLPYWLIEYQTGLVRHVKGVGGRVESDSYLIDCFREVFPHTYPLDWFDLELKKYTGIDVYSKKYDRNTGYSVYERGRYKLLLLDINKINELQGVIEEFVNHPVVFSDGNEGERKWYASLYREFKSEYLDEYRKDKSIKSSKYYRHFYAG